MSEQENNAAVPYDDEIDDEWACTFCGGDGYAEVDDRCGTTATSSAGAIVLLAAALGCASIKRCSET